MAGNSWIVLHGAQNNKKTAPAETIHERFPIIKKVFHHD
jgi:hypothetical protein